MFQKKKKEKSQLGSDISGIMCSTLTVTCCNSDLQILEKKMMMYHVSTLYFYFLICNFLQLGSCDEARDFNINSSNVVFGKLKELFIIMLLVIRQWYVLVYWDSVGSRNMINSC